ncbi:MAG: RNA polymerase sigma factor [Pirellulales bacterium]|nr:RNA polymerase sigma factor [Pirellulales bacterium]
MNSVGPELLTRLLDEHGGALVLYARQWCRTPEDVVQEALLSLVKQQPVPENVVGWLYRVVRNGAISVSRSALRRTRREAMCAQRGELWFQAAPEDRLDADAATAALGRLPIEQRETIVARLWGGLTFEEIAELTGSSTSSVHRWYQTGLSALRERLGVACPNRNAAKQAKEV